MFVEFCPSFFLFSGNANLFPRVGHQREDVSQGQGRSVYHKQNYSAQSSAFPNHSSKDCHISMNYAFSSFPGHGSVTPGHLKLCMICSVLFVQFNFLLHFYLFMFHHFIYSAQRAKNCSAMDRPSTAVSDGPARDRPTRSQDESVGFWHAALLSLEQQGEYL